VGIMTALVAVAEAPLISANIRASCEGLVLRWRRAEAQMRVGRRGARHATPLDHFDVIAARLIEGLRENVLAYGANAVGLFCAKVARSPRSGHVFEHKPNQHLMKMQIACRKL